MMDQTSSLQFAVAISRNSNEKEAAQSLCHDIQKELGSNPVDLAFIFFSAHYEPHIQAISTFLEQQLSVHCLLGSMGEGVIAGSEEIEEGPAISIWAARLPEVTITPVRLAPPPSDERDMRQDWLEPLGMHITPQAFLILADPFTTPMNEVLSSTNDRCPGVPVIGGLASGGQEDGANRLLLNSEMFHDGLVGVALSGAICINPIISQGCRPFGERFIVTKAQHNVVHELSGQPALKQLEAVFESLPLEEQHLAQRALHVGLIIDEHRNRFERGDFLVRNLIGADRSTGSLVFGDLAQEGQTIQFHVRDADSASEDFSLMLSEMRAVSTKPPLGALLFSCCGRGKGLFGKPHHDIGILRKETGNIPIGGFFAQGEIGPVGGNNFLHGYTASVALFTEPVN